MIVTYCVSGALCGEALEFLGLFRKEVPSGVWGGASKSSPSLRSVRELGVGWLRYVGALEQRRSRLLAPRQGGGVRLRGNVWLSRSPLHPVCRYDEVICSEMTRGLQRRGTIYVWCKIKPRTTEKAFPFEGEGGTPVPDEGEIGERTPRNCFSFLHPTKFTRFLLTFSGASCII